MSKFGQFKLEKCLDTHQKHSSHRRAVTKFIKGRDEIMKVLYLEYRQHRASQSRKLCAAGHNEGLRHTVRKCRSAVSWKRLIHDRKRNDTVAEFRGRKQSVIRGKQMR